MKYRILRLSICISILVSLVALSFALIRPIYLSLGNVMRSKINELNSTLDKSFGLKVSYSSLSPSILTGINIKSIVVKDSQSDEPVVLIDKLSANFSLLEILKGNFINSISEIIIKDVNVKIIQNKNTAWINYALKNQVEKNQKTVQVEKKSLIDLLCSSEIDINIPFDISVHNLIVSYENQKEKIFLDFDIRKSNLERLASYKKYNVELFGRMNGTIKNNSISSNLFLRSSLLGEINNSSAVIQFYNTKYNSYSISQIGFISEFVDSVFLFKMLPTVQNIYFEVVANLLKNTMNIGLDCNDFMISKLVSGINRNSTLGIFSNFLISTNFQLFYNEESKALKYSANADIDIPSSFIQDGANLKFKLNGNENFLTLSNFECIGNKIDFNALGECNLKTVQPTGTLSLNKFELENGQSISAEFFIEPMRKGFMIFSPEILIGQKVFTAAQLNCEPSNDSYDFDFEVYDYSHIASGEPGVLKFNGNYLTLSKYLQANVSLEGMYIDSLLETTSCFLDKNTAGLINDISKFFKSTVFSTDIYLTSFDKNFSYNIPSAIIADTNSDSKMLIFSMDGNKETIQLNRFELVFDDQKIFASAHAEKIYEQELKQIQRILTGQVEINSIPYSFNGLLNKDWISITGDYGLEFSIFSDKETENLLGNFMLNEFPIKISDTIFSVSADTNFFYNVLDKININISKFIVQTNDIFATENPMFAFVGNINKEGAVFEEIAYTDYSSNLSGAGVVNINYLDENFVDANYDFSLSDPLYNEQVVVTGTISNPLKKALSKESLFKDFYISCVVKLSSFRTGRFVNNTHSNYTMDGEISVTGVLSNPMVTISVPSGHAFVNNEELSFSLFASIVDLEFELSDSYFKLGEKEILNIKSNFSFKDWNGFFSCDFKMGILDKEISCPLKLEFKNLQNDSKEKIIPSAYEIYLSSSKVGGSFIKSPQPIFIKMRKENGITNFSSSNNIGLTGSILENGLMSLVIDNKVPFKLKVDGNLNKKNSDIKFYDIEVDLKKVFDVIDYSFIKIYEGKLIGNFKITGAKGDRGFDGELQIIPAEFSIPTYFKKHAYTDVIYINMSKNKIATSKTRCVLRRALVDVTLTAEFNNLVYDGINILVKTVDDYYAPVDVNMNYIHVKGNAQVDLDISVGVDSTTVLGSVVAKDTTAEFGTTTIEDVVLNFNQQESNEENDVELKLDVTMKSRVQVFYSSFLRGLVVPDSKVVVTHTSEDEKTTLDGTVPLRSGEIIYLNSSFYIKEGLIEFSENDEGINPFVSLRAEIRERDESDNDVTISLAVDHQRISELSPKLSSSPAKSEKEIMELLGNIVTANSSDMSSFMLATGDYALQTMVMRKVENALRDLLNFDILSIRTMVVQNALKYSVSKDSDRQGINISNFFDNTTVYIGKYLGSDLYADAMFRLAYDKSRKNDGSTLQGLVLKPEIGLEMESPIANIRWSVAPDLSDLSRQKIMFVPSLTLSWSFNY